MADKLDFSSQGELVEGTKLDFSKQGDLVQEEAPISQTQEERNAAFSSEPPLLNTEFIGRIPGNLAEAGGAIVGAGEAIVEGMQEAPLQTIAGVGTGLAGGVFSKAGPLGFAKRAMFDVPFQWGAKELEELLGISSDDDLAIVNLAEAMVEQLGAEGGMWLLKKSGLLKQLAPNTIKILFKDKSSPKSVGQMKAHQVEKEVFGGEEIFLAEERTAGEQGGSAATNLATEATIAKEIYSGDPKRAKLLARNNKIQKEMRKRLLKLDSTQQDVIRPSDVAEAMQSSADTRLTKLDKTADDALNHSGRVADTLSKTRDFDAASLKKVLVDNKAVIERSIGKADYAATLKKLANARTFTSKGTEKVKVVNKFTGGFSFKDKKIDVTEISDKLTGKDTFDILEGMLTTFSDKHERGVFLKKIWGPITGVLEQARGTTSDELADSYLRANNGYIAISDLKKSTAYQTMLSATEDSLPSILKNPHLYDKVVAIDKAAGGSAKETLPRILDNFAIDQLIDPSTKEITAENVFKFMKTYKRENIRKVLGADRLKQFDLIGSMAHFLAQNKVIKNIARASTKPQTMAEAVGEGIQNVGATQVHVVPRKNINSGVALVSDFIRKKLNITDASALDKAMKSQAIKQYVKENMSNPNSYPLYVNMMREIGIKAVGRATYDEAMESVEGLGTDFINDPNAPDFSMEGILIEDFIPNRELNVETFDNTSPQQGGVQGKLTTTPEESSNLTSFIDKVIEIESSGNPKALNKTTSASGAFQFVKDSVAPALNRLARLGDMPKWAKDLQTKYKKGVTRKEHQELITNLSIEQQTELFLADITQKIVGSKKGLGDALMKRILSGDVEAMKELYAKGHHTKPDKKTLEVMEKVFNK